MGFQRIVKEDRARDIARAVLNQGRTFPNAIVLATDVESFPGQDGHIAFPPAAKFLVVDGQHRLWAQKFSDRDSLYACTIHFGLTEVQMAQLFVEINNNQKRVPPSLRWDLIRLIQPEDDPYGLAATELIYELATEENSPLFQRVDLTGEQGQITLKQASIAPEIKACIAATQAPLHEDRIDELKSVFRRYFSALQSVDTDAWDSGTTPFQQNRTMRAMLRLPLAISQREQKDIFMLSVDDFIEHIRRIDVTSLEPDRIRAMQGQAGIAEIFNVIQGQVFGE